MQKNPEQWPWFGEKYGDSVRVVSMGDFSRELCGGTHVPNTGVITTFKIVSEAGVAAGVRRIEALTGDGVFHYYKEVEKKLNEAAGALKTTPAEVLEKNFSSAGRNESTAQ